MSSGGCIRAIGGLLAAASLALVVGACGGEGEDGPALHRPPKAVWCPAPWPSSLGHRPKHEPDQWDAREVIGLKVEDAERLAERHGCSLRMVGGKDVDPEAVLTMDARNDRVNVDVSDGIVVALDGKAAGGVIV